MATPSVENKGYVKIDVVAFQSVMSNNGLSTSKFAEPLGRTGSWVRDIIKRGTMHMADYLAFKSYYGVDLKVTCKPDTLSDGESCEYYLKQILFKLDDISERLKVLEVLS